MRIDANKRLRRAVVRMMSVIVISLHNELECAGCFLRKPIGWLLLQLAGKAAILKIAVLNDNRFESSRYLK
ncbi:hypothetical protein NEIELOOT_02717 [Neisseria elongata subsp. glycolytica ATCC 29315]|uniref:Uncharacterized protein n=1 Tax=Neisseria elongata subsp. glycolytica ATCC 29315 TaxID=546263 RepID=D4DUF8_NEIEG|nr:hypothetical protein NEIELOOT_02717 [Neisseria elongata subsp. glycolytica ATCC 29315]